MMQLTLEPYINLTLSLFFFYFVFVFPSVPQSKIVFSLSLFYFYPSLHLRWRGPPVFLPVPILWSPNQRLGEGKKWGLFCKAKKGHWFVPFALPFGPLPFGPPNQRLGSVFLPTLWGGQRKNRGAGEAGKQSGFFLLCKKIKLAYFLLTFLQSKKGKKSANPFLQSKKDPTLWVGEACPSPPPLSSIFSGSPSLSPIFDWGGGRRHNQRLCRRSLLLRSPSFPALPTPIFDWVLFIPSDPTGGVFFAKQKRGRAKKRERKRWGTKPPPYPFRGVLPPNQRLGTKMERRRKSRKSRRRRGKK